MTDRLAHLTPAQREAIETVDRSVVVSAAAGSGKTTVLAERCASLICDGPRDQRCTADEILVVTFTEAAASEMRNRIRRAIHARWRENPNDHYLREQLYLIDGAAISTIHAFCNQLIRRWFPQADIDPQAHMLSGDQAAALEQQVLEELFTELYEYTSATGDAFRSMVEVYGGGNDREIMPHVLRMVHYCSSLADPQVWIEESLRRVDPAQPESLFARMDTLQAERLRRELEAQVTHHAQMADMIRTQWPAGSPYADVLDSFGEGLVATRARLVDDTAWESVCTELLEAKYNRVSGRPKEMTESQETEYEMAKGVRGEVKKLFDKRLLGMCHLTRDHFELGLRQIAPHIQALVELTRLFEQRYDDAKSRRAAMDFNDLQRKALTLLTDPDTGGPSSIAKQLQEAYRHVLVDEFQDVDPLQAAILQRVSRESDPDRPGNLFTVGDIKQSIYRFRLAEPKVFSERVSTFREHAEAGRLIHLRENFRSRPNVVEAINAVFKPLMSAPFGGCDYTEEHELFAGLSYPEHEQSFDRTALELHVLQAVTEHTRVDAEEDEDAGSKETGGAWDEELEGIDREAHLIGSRIQSWMGQAGASRVQVATRGPDGGLAMRPVEYRDIVILLRAMPHKAQPIAEVLRRMQIPVAIGREQGRLDGSECRDVIALLRLIDNPRQDIPLAAVLRSPILGDPFNETELVRLRRHQQDLPFHESILDYACGDDEDEFRDRVRTVLGRVEYYRRRAQQVSLAELVTLVCEDHHTLQYVAGLPDGMRRRENLIRLQDLARQFEASGESSLLDFLAYLDELEEGGGPRSSSGAPGSSEDVVRIMTVHNSKGLEFPVVVLADAGKRFNTDDRKGMVLIDREWGIAMRAADGERRVNYDTLLHQLASENARRESLSEEVRLLYVALTRAREHVMVVGRASDALLDTCRQAGGREPTSEISLMSREEAGHPLGWLVAALQTFPIDKVWWGSQRQGPDAPLAEVRTYDRAETDAWALPERVQTEHDDRLRQIAEGRPLDRSEPGDADAAEVRNIIDRIGRPYAHEEMTTLPASIAVTELERRDEDPSAPVATRPTAGSDLPALPAFMDASADNESIARGLAMHRYLQLLELQIAGDVSSLRSQAEALATAGRISHEDLQLLDLDAIHWFFQTEPGRRLRATPQQVRREIGFSARIAPQHYDSAISSDDPRDAMLVRGMVDALRVSEEALELLDYKTDRVPAERIGERAALYRSQILAYTRAVETVYQKPVTNAWLVFLHPRELVLVER